MILPLIFAQNLNLAITFVFCSPHLSNNSNNSFHNFKFSNKDICIVLTIFKKIKITAATLLKI